jgi:uncharacterized membrane protein
MDYVAVALVSAAVGWFVTEWNVALWYARRRREERGE